MYKNRGKNLKKKNSNLYIWQIKIFYYANLNLTIKTHTFISLDFPPQKIKENIKTCKL